MTIKGTFEELLAEVTNDFARSVKTLEEERPVIKLIGNTLKQFGAFDIEPHAQGGGYCNRPFGVGTHNRPVLQYQMKNLDDEATILELLTVLRVEAAKLDLDIHLEKLSAPEGVWRRWVYHYKWKRDEKDSIYFGVIVWMAVDGVCQLVEDGYKDPEKKYRIECKERESEGNLANGEAENV